MGRMADARKRAKAKQEAALEAAPVATPEPESSAAPVAAEPAAEELVFPAEEPVVEPAAPAPAPPAAEAAVEPAATWVARAEAIGFPEASSPAPVAAAAPRLSLPASGLADDILRELEQRQAIEVAPVAAPATGPVPEATNQSYSFFAAPQREEKKAVEAQEHLATFFLAGEEYGVDVRLVQEIIRVAEITQVPRAPAHIRGVINLRGRIIPVVDLRRKLELGTVEASKQARIVVVKLRDRLVGLLVDGASQVLKVPQSLVEPPPEEVVEVHQNAIRGVAKLQDRLIILLDLMKALASELRETGPADERAS